MKKIDKLKTFLKLKSNKKIVRRMTRELSSWYTECSGLTGYRPTDEAKILFLMSCGVSLRDAIMAVYDVEK